MPVSENKSALLLKAEAINKQLDKIQQDSHSALRTSTPTPERRENSMYNDAAASIKRDDSNTYAAQKKPSRSEAELDAEKVSTGKMEQGLRKVFKNAAYALALEFPRMSLDDIKDKLELDVDAEKIKDIEQKFKEDMGEAEQLDQIKVSQNGFVMEPDADIDPEAGMTPDSMDPTLRLDRGPENLPNLQGGIQAVRLYEEGNRVGVILYTDKANYIGPAANILEFFEQKLDDRERYLENKAEIRNENTQVRDNAKESSNQAKEQQKEPPKPTPAAEQSHQEKEHEAPKNVPKNPTNTNPYS